MALFWIHRLEIVWVSLASTNPEISKQVGLVGLVASNPPKKLSPLRGAYWVRLDWFLWDPLEKRLYPHPTSSASRPSHSLRPSSRRRPSAVARRLTVDAQLPTPPSAACLPSAHRLKLEVCRSPPIRRTPGDLRPKAEPSVD